MAWAALVAITCRTAGTSRGGSEANKIYCMPWDRAGRSPKAALQTSARVFVVPSFSRNTAQI